MKLQRPTSRLLLLLQTSHTYRHTYKQTYISSTRWYSQQQPSLPLLSSPVAFQDRGKNKDKLLFYPQHNVTDPLPLQQLHADTQQQHKQQSSNHTTEHQLFVSLFPGCPVVFVPVFSPLFGWLHHLLPRNYPHSVSIDYTSYTKWTFVSSVFATVSGVLSMQCLLFAVGVGQPLSVPAAAAIQWVLKDGLGQFGGILFASYANISFDSDPKRWRMLAAVAADASVCVEICTPLFPAAFLPLASIANIGKNISWLSTSAAKAAIHRSLIKEENLADITAKASSQSIAASLIGTAVGIAFSYSVGTNPYYILCVFAALSLAHITATYKSLCAVGLATINAQRGERIMLTYTRTGNIPTQQQIKQQENFFSTYTSPFHAHSRLNTTCTLNELLAQFIPIHQATATATAGAAPAHTTPTVTAAAASGVSALSALLAFYAQESFFLSISLSGCVYLLFTTAANAADVLCGYLLATKCRYQMQMQRQHSSSSTSFSSSSSSSAAQQPYNHHDLSTLLSSSLAWLRAHRDDFLARLTAQHWNVQHLFIESDKTNRVRILDTAADTAASQ